MIFSPSTVSGMMTERFAPVGDSRTSSSWFDRVRRISAMAVPDGLGLSAFTVFLLLLLRGGGESFKLLVGHSAKSLGLFGKAEAGEHGDALKAVVEVRHWSLPLRRGDRLGILVAAAEVSPSQLRHPAPILPSRPLRAGWRVRLIAV